MVKSNIRCYNGIVTLGTYFAYGFSKYNSRYFVVTIGEWLEGIHEW